MEKPNYYAILTADVRYDKRLCPNSKILYAEITALCNMNGACFATNAYFANLYNVSTKSISQWVKSLIDCGYITSEISYKTESKEIDKRYIQLTYGKNLPYPMEENFHTPMEEKVKDNINTTYVVNNNPTDSNIGIKQKKGCRFENSVFFSDVAPDEFLTEAEKINPNVDPFEQYKMFKDYWVSASGRNAVKLDWIATWRNWIRRAYQSNGNTKRQKTAAEMFADMTNW